MIRTLRFGSISLALVALAALLMGCGSGNDLGDTLDGSWRLSATGVAEGATLPVPGFLAYDMVIDDSTIIGEGGGGEAKNLTVISRNRTGTSTTFVSTITDRGGSTKAVTFRLADGGRELTLIDNSRNLDKVRRFDRQ